MQHKKLAFHLVFFLIISVAASINVSAHCFQDSNNVSNVCNPFSLETSTYFDAQWNSSGNIVDDDWGTYGTGNTVNDSFHYVNFTVPFAAKDPLLQLKYTIWYTGYSISTINISIHESCYNDSNVTLRMKTVAEPRLYIHCNDSGHLWRQLFLYNPMRTIWDYGIWWDYYNVNLTMVYPSGTLPSDIYTCFNNTDNCYTSNPVLLPKNSYGAYEDTEVYILDRDLNKTTNYIFRPYLNQSKQINITIPNEIAQFIISEPVEALLSSTLGYGIPYASSKAFNVSYDNLSGTHATFGFNSPYYLQAYQWDITDTPDIYINLFYLKDPDTKMYFRVSDKNRERTGLKVNMYQLNQTSSTNPYLLTSSRYTDGSGFVYFYFNSSKPAKITIEDEDFKLNYPVLLSPTDITNNTKTNPWDITLSINTTSTSVFSYTIPYVTYNKSNDIPVLVNYMPGHTIGFRTNYTLNLGQAIEPCSNTMVVTPSIFLDSVINYNLLGNVYNCQVDSGIDFLNYTNDNITIHLYRDGILEVSHTVQYLDPSVLNVSSIGTITHQDIEVRFLNPLLFFALIMITLVSQYLFKSDTNQVGLHTFLIGCILLSTISTSFFIVSVLPLIYYILRGIRPLLGVTQ